VAVAARAVLVLLLGLLSGLLSRLLSGLLSRLLSFNTSKRVSSVGGTNSSGGSTSIGRIGWLLRWLLRVCAMVKNSN
jgi:hypothetical protein